MSLAIIGAAVCLALGISLPIIRLTKYVFWSTEHSLLSTVEVLIRDGQTFLGGTVLVFSIVLPILKLLYLLLISTLPAAELTHQSRRLKALEWLGKWSMHDVLVLALTIFFIKAQGVYDAASLSGVYYFTAAVVLMILSYAWLRTEGLAARLPEDPPTQSVLVRQISPFRNFVLSFLIILATVFFALGIILPVIRFTTVYVWTNEHSIATIIWALFENQEYFLTVVLFLFSIFFPFLKLFYLLTLVTSPDIPPEFRKRSISTMEWLGRYSMTDVMVLALMIFYVNSSGYTEATVLPGVYFFAASAIITMLAYGWANTVPVSRRAASNAPEAPPPRSRPRVRSRPKAASPDAPATVQNPVVTLPTNPGRRHRPA
ncbi:MAG: paraquat-inducible protein A [Hyphomicrobium sp.]|uniref:paraquat-inducible protein A n=1 Tax=Hyphomicrobium sp. TaxID=82 RepID=UPI003D10A28B